MTSSRRTSVLLAAVVTLVAVCAWLLGSARSGPAVAAATADPTPGTARQGVHVSAVGEVTGVPDVLRLDLGVQVRRASVSDALGVASSAMAKVRDALRKGGVAKRDLQTTGVDISPTYDDKGGSITGYEVSQRLSAKLRDLGKAGRLIDAAARAGGNATRVSGVSFAIDDDDALLADARRKAFAAARARAELYADAAGRPLGAVVSIDEGVQRDGPVYAADAALATSARAAIPVEPGTQRLSVTVTVDWAFR